MGAKSETKVQSFTTSEKSTAEQRTEIQSSQIEFASGDERRREALERRQEFLKQQEDLHMEIKTSDIKVKNVKSRQQLEEEREAYIKKTIMMVQGEAMILSKRAKEEEEKRTQYLQLEEERIKREDESRQAP